jgi:hypothetical protein
MVGQKINITPSPLIMISSRLTLLFKTAQRALRVLNEPIVNAGRVKKVLALQLSYLLHHLNFHQTNAALVSKSRLFEWERRFNDFFFKAGVFPEYSHWPYNSK